jgi:hypothetical protein
VPAPASIPHYPAEELSRAGLGPETFRTSWDVGIKLTPEEAIESCLRLRTVLDLAGDDGFTR